MSNLPRLVKRGDPIRAADWNHVQRALAGGLMQTTSPKGVMKSGVVFIRNTLSTTVKRYSSYSLGNSVWTLDRDRNLIDCVFELVAYSASKPVAVLQQPLAPYTTADPEIGLAVVDGSTLVEVNGSGSATDLFATPQSDGRLQASASGPIRLAQARPSGGGFVLGIIGIGGGSSMRMFKTPTAGIPAASGGAPGSASCTEYPSGMSGAAGASSVVKNHRTSIIPGEVFILALPFGADLYCVEGNCPTVIAEPAPEDP